MAPTTLSQRPALFIKGIVQNPSHLFRSVIILCLFLMLLLMYQKSMCPKQKQNYICIEDPELLKLSGLEKVEFLPFNGATPQDCLTKVSLRESLLSSDEQSRSEQCVKNYEKDFKSAHELFWYGDNQYIRHKHHKYLTNQSLILDIGGNVGEDAEYLIQHYNPKNYVVLEPLKLLYRNLVSKFKHRRNVITYNVGLSKKNEVFMLNIEGHDGDATSPFLGKTTDGTCSLKVVNTTAFLTKLGVGCYDVDLVTINCEGCEYDVLESLLATSLINHFKHIQFATHTKLQYLVDPVKRYCKIQELLQRTHRLSYSYRFNWETWTRRDITV
ncbi:uncharacterized protein LOC117342161 [Pecten maximus]|uniref:uncharacterized protein LOC117342161 n=1 Tax=Pecten maximus TaxID=6579 RepID=UPI0014589CEE|nr:uncharacterized protein LOC117342161 [Pecten maximus]XP_033760066.1 uncharacterized protein LOC117342161 [Pecten maximus]